MDSTRNTASLLSNIVNNLFEGIHKTKCTNCSKCCLEHTNFEDGLIQFKCFCHKKIFKKILTWRLEDITDTGCKYAKRFCKNVKVKNVDE